MFTIRWMFTSGPEKTPGEELYSTKLVSKCTDGKLRFTRDDAREASGVDTVIDIGDVFVMNDAGKTVAQYFFGDQPFAAGIAA